MQCSSFAGSESCDQGGSCCVSAQHGTTFCIALHLAICSLLEQHAFMRIRTSSLCSHFMCAIVCHQMLVASEADSTCCCGSCNVCCTSFPSTLNHAQDLERAAGQYVGSACEASGERLHPGQGSSKGAHPCGPHWPHLLCSPSPRC